MNYHVEITQQAAADLRAMFSYIAFEIPQQNSLQNAQGQLSRLEQSIYSLCQFPERCSQYPNEPWKSRGLRSMPVDNYCIFYIPDRDKGIVYILRVLYKGRDIHNVWMNETP